MIKVAITQGDYNGVGPEVALKSLQGEEILSLFTPVLFADRRIVERATADFNLNLPLVNFVESASDACDGRLNVVDLKLKEVDVNPGKPDAKSGRAAVLSLEAAVVAVTEGLADVLVTAPINKEAIQGEGFHFPGHTEYLEAKAGEGCKAQMILFDDRLRVALVTTHLPVSQLAGAISSEKVEDSVKAMAATLVKDFGIVRPKIAVLSLNPHCGDGGLLGSEEKESIEPAVKACIEQGVLAFGPFAADGFFGSLAYKRFDGVLAMYHDQGLGPFKTLAGDAGVNFTAGLPFVRTSPDHGTACDIAWKGEADPTSMREAIYKAIDIFRRRKAYTEASANPLKHQAFEPRPKNRSDRRPDAIKRQDPEQPKSGEESNIGKP